jgi:chemotaxis protein MotB
MALGSDSPILIKKIKKVSGHAHHGGAWKVAYADFVTAMMAFFLLMWLINTTSPEQKKGIADYFAPASVSETTSGSGSVLGGTALASDGMNSQGAKSVIDAKSPSAPDGEGQASNADSNATTGPSDQADQKDDSAFQSAAASLRQALQDMPELAELSKQIHVDQTPEGLRIMLSDDEGRPMFDQGSPKPNDRARVLLRAVARVINQLPNRITITGDTSASPDGKKHPEDWDLSMQRANASRAILQQAGVDSDRIRRVSGDGSSDPLFPDDPTLAGNRRIAIVLLREAPVLPPNH